jgi:hypothetical protein
MIRSVGREREVRQQVRYTVLGLWLLALLLGAGRYRVAQAGVMTAEGVGVILQGNQAAARQRAIQDGLRKAIEQSVADAVSASSSMERLRSLQARLTARPGQYIRSYRVLWEYPDVAQKVYRVGLEVELTLALVQTVTGRPRLESLRVILVRMVERQLDQNGQQLSGAGEGIVTAAMRDKLQGWGYRVISPDAETVWDGQDISAVTEAREAGAGVLIIGVAEARQLRSEASVHLIQATAQARLLVAKTREQLAQERRQTTVVHADAQAGVHQALQDTASALVERFAAPLQTYQQQVREQQVREQQLREQQQVREQQLREQQLREPQVPEEDGPERAEQP